MNAHHEMELLTATLDNRATSTRAGHLIAHPLFKGLLYLSADLAMLWSARAAVRSLVLAPLHMPSSDVLFRYSCAFVPFFVMTLYFFDGYGDPDLRRPDRELEVLTTGVTVAFFGLLVAAILASGLSSTSYYVGAWYFTTLTFAIWFRFVLRGVYGYIWKQGWCRTRVLLMGPPVQLLDYQNLLELSRHRGYDIVGILSSEEDCAFSYASEKLPIFGNLLHWEDVFRSHDIQLVLLSPHADCDYILSDVVRRCSNLGIPVMLFDNIFNTREFDCAIDTFTGGIQLRFRSRVSLTLHRVCKRTSDLIFGLVGSGLVLVMTPIMAALIKLEDGGPVFYRSAYLGQDGKNRYYLKFRSMCLDADQVLACDEQLREKFEHKFKLETDPRVTRIGKFLRKYSLDEFPQFFSILSGDLSLVGPRTIRREEAARYGDLLSKLLSFKPGVTGFWQVMGRQTTTYEERVQMDMFYIDHWSMWFDLVIIAKTFWTVLSARGAY